MYADRTPQLYPHVYIARHVDYCLELRFIFRSLFQEDLDRAKGYLETEADQKAMRKRALWTEPLFGEAKQFHQLKRFRSTLRQRHPARMLALAGVRERYYAAIASRYI